MASIAAARAASTSVRCSFCNYNVLNAFASVCGARLRQPETLRTLPSRVSRRKFIVPLNRQFHSSHFFLQEQSQGENLGREDEVKASEDNSLTATSTVNTSVEGIETKPAAAEEHEGVFEESELDEEDLLEDGQPWYLGEDAVPPPPVQFVSPFIQPVPDVPPNSPPFMKDLFVHLTKDLGFSSLSVVDLRGVDSATTMGGDLIVVICTARSPRHLHIGADKCVRHMRANFHFRAHADGLIPKSEIRLKERRRRRKGKILTAAEEEDNIVRWVCIDTRKGVLIQVMTKDKREDVDLEGLLQAEVERSERKRARGEARIMEYLETNKDRTLEDLQATDLIKDEPPVKLRGIRSRVVKRQNFMMYTRPNAKSVSGPTVARRHFHWNSWSEVTASSLPLSDSSFPAMNTPVQGQALDALKFAVQEGDFEGIKELIPKPWGHAERLVILETHLNHLRLVTRRSPAVAVEQLLSADESNPWDSYFMKSFWEVFKNHTTPAMFHARALLLIHAHFIERTEYPSVEYFRNVYPFELFREVPELMMNKDQYVLPETFYVILRALATSPALRPGALHHSTGSAELTDARLKEMLPIMEMMQKEGYDMSNDVGVQSALFFAASPASTGSYMSELGDLNCPRSAKVIAGRQVIRQYDWRLQQFAKVRLQNNSTAAYEAEKRYLTGGYPGQSRELPSGENKIIQRAPTRNLPMLSMNPLAGTSLAKVPLPDATALVVYARAQDWDEFFSYYRSLRFHGFELPPQMYSLIFELVAREGSPQHALLCLRKLWTDLQQGEGKMVFDHGIAAGLVGCFREMKNSHSELLYEFRELRSHIGRYLQSNGLALTNEYGITEFFDGEYFQKGMLHIQNVSFFSVGPVALVVAADGVDVGDDTADIEDLLLRGGRHCSISGDREQRFDSNDHETSGFGGGEYDESAGAGAGADADGLGILESLHAWPLASEVENSGKEGLWSYKDGHWGKEDEEQLQHTSVSTITSGDVNPDVKLVSSAPSKGRTEKWKSAGWKPRKEKWYSSKVKSAMNLKDWEKRMRRKPFEVKRMESQSTRPDIYFTAGAVTAPRVRKFKARKELRFMKRHRNHDRAYFDME